MKRLAFLFALMAFPVMAAAGDIGRPAYPDRWNGGPPLPPLGAADAPPADIYSIYPLAPPPQPQAPQVLVTVPETVTDDCIRSNLRGTHWQDGCGKLNLSPAQAAALRRTYLQ